MIIISSLIIFGIPIFVFADQETAGTCDYGNGSRYFWCKGGALACSRSDYKADTMDAGMDSYCVPLGQSKIGCTKTSEQPTQCGQTGGATGGCCVHKSGQTVTSCDFLDLGSIGPNSDLLTEIDKCKAGEQGGVSQWKQGTGCTQIPDCQTGQQRTNIKEWTKDDCRQAGGDWIPPGNETSGQYCYAKQDINYTPQISIGGTTITNLGDYIAKAYNYALGFVLMIAIIMTMIGGVQYIMARGGGGVGAAKKRIGNAILGVVLLLCAYLILNTISPAIVKLSLPRVPLIKKIPQPSLSQQNTETIRKAYKEVSKGGLCETDSNCKEGLKCTQISSAVKVCGDASTSSGCDPSKTQGTTNPDCATGFRCIKNGNIGFCSNGQQGNPCGSDDDCDVKFTCTAIGYSSYGYCSLREKQTAGKCMTNSDCVAGATCIRPFNTPSSQSGVCSAGMAGEQCYQHSQCKPAAQYCLPAGDKCICQETGPGPGEKECGE